MAEPKDWMKSAAWIMRTAQDTKDARPVRGLEGWGQALAEICIQQWGGDPGTLVPLLEKLEGRI